MQLPAHIFYLLRILYYETEPTARDEWGTLADLVYYALLSDAVYKLDEMSNGNRSVVHLNKLDEKSYAAVISYRTRLITAKILAPLSIAEREFVFEEYLALCEVNSKVDVESDLLTDDISAEAIKELGSELESVLLPALDHCYRRSQGLPRRVD